MDYPPMSIFHIPFLLFAMSFFTTSWSQGVTETLAGVRYDIDSLRSLAGTGKSFPHGYELQGLLALSRYPELKNTRIEIKFTNTQSLLLSTISFHGMFQHASKRTYKILLRTTSESKLAPALFSNLSFDGQIAALAHELAHTLEFRQKSFGGMVDVALRHLSKKAIDHQEQSADMQVISRGLGFQMYAWRKSTAKAFGTKQTEKPPGEQERYMGPQTVLHTMLDASLYSAWRHKINTLLAQHSE
jgi:hypothetical protein